MLLNQYKICIWYVPLLRLTDFYKFPMKITNSEKFICNYLEFSYNFVLIFTIQRTIWWVHFRVQKLKSVHIGENSNELLHFCSTNSWIIKIRRVSYSYSYFLLRYILEIYWLHFGKQRLTKYKSYDPLFIYSNIVNYW